MNNKKFIEVHGETLLQYLKSQMTFFLNVQFYQEPQRNEIIFACMESPRKLLKINTMGR